MRVLQGASVIGVTTSGLARNLDMFRRLDAKVLLCEEAAEILENHILTALLPSIEHAILIRDHLQLRPRALNYELSASNPRGQQYLIDVSLLERLVKPARATDLKLPFDTLETQRRMHPSISSLVRETLYPTLQDAEKVRAYPEVVGMRKRLFWFNHDKPEAEAAHTKTSPINDFEIEMVCGLVSHLVRQRAYGPGDIAVLTPYHGQLQKIRAKLRNLFEDIEDLHTEGLEPTPQVSEWSLGSCVRLSTVDNFQGEEAKVVVVSLVRSNREGHCGFLGTINRINVATVEMWSKVIENLKRQGSFGRKLPLRCPRHEYTLIEVSEPGDFARLSPEGGCNLPCSRKLNCGHTCPGKCHATYR
ncbi:AAA domain-containing protein [Hypoxylon sp. FL0543]|nr:AAA domain-containing protein [Hypoxylon sp. FL0543]